MLNARRKSKEFWIINNKKLKSITDEISISIKKLDGLTKKKDNDMESLQRRIREHQEYIEKLEVQKQSLECEMLVKQIKEIEEDNDRLRQKLESSKTNVGSFIQEMSSIIGTHEFQLLMEGQDPERFEYNHYGNGTDEFEDPHQHAGTGGSSKVKKYKHSQF